MPLRQRRRNSLPLIHEQQFPGAVAPRFGRPQVEHGTPGQLYALCGYDEEGILRALLDTRA